MADLAFDPGRRALVEALLAAHPDDDEPLLVYADYLQHHGDARGELIAMQTRALREPSDAIAQRERALLDDHEAVWLGPWQGRALAWRFHRGFLHHLQVSLDRFVDMARDIVALEQLSDHLVHIRSLHLDTALYETPAAVIDDLLAIARDAPLRLETLTLSHELDRAIATRYASSAGLLASTTALRIIRASTRHGTLEALCDSPHLGRLHTLELRNAAVDDAAATALAAHRRFEQVRSLSLANQGSLHANDLHRDALCALVTAHDQLTALDLSGLFSLIDARVLAALARTGGRLTSLALAHSRIDSQCAPLLARLVALRHLDVRHTELDDDALAPILSLRRLQSLNLAHTQITEDGARQLLRDAPPSLREVTIAVRRLHPVLAQRLAHRFVLHRWQ